MSQNTTTFETIIDDMKSSLKLALNNILSYFLANLGMAVLAVVFMAILVIPIAVIAFLSGPAALSAWGASMATWGPANMWAAGTVGFFLVVIPVVAFSFIFFGSIYGMSKELVETGETKAETAFSWLRHNFLTFASVGVVLSLIVLSPQFLVTVLLFYSGNYVVTGWVSFGLSIFSFAYSFITLGLTSMVLPAVVNGKGVQEAFKESFRLATERFDRVFGIHTAIVGLGFLTFSPPLIGSAAVALGFSPLLFGPYFIIAGIWAVLAGLAWLLLFLPMTFIAYVRVYNDLTGGIVNDPTPNTSEIAMV